MALTFILPCQREYTDFEIIYMKYMHTRDMWMNASTYFLNPYIICYIMQIIISNVEGLTYYYARGCTDRGLCPWSEAAGASAPWHQVTAVTIGLVHSSGLTEGCRVKSDLKPKKRQIIQCLRSWTLWKYWWIVLCLALNTKKRQTFNAFVHEHCGLVGWLVVLRIYVALAVLQPYRSRR